MVLSPPTSLPSPTFTSSRQSPRPRRQLFLTRNATSLYLSIKSLQHKRHPFPLPRPPQSGVLLPALLFSSMGSPYPRECSYVSSQETSASLTMSMFPLIASIRPAKNRKMAPCNDTHEDLCVSTGYGWDGVTSRGWSHLGVSVQVGLQQLLCFLDVDISSTCGWQGEALLWFPLRGPALLLATCHGLLGASVFPSVKWHDSPYLQGDRGLEQANVYTVQAHHRLNNLGAISESAAVIFTPSTRWHNHPHFTEGTCADRPGAAGPLTWFCPVLGARVGSASRTQEPATPAHRVSYRAQR